MVTSYWGDEHMFFRHQRMEDDLVYRPEWTPYTPVFKVFAEQDTSFVRDTVSNFLSGCPFAYLFQ